MTKAELFIDYAMRYVGIPYKWGGYNPISGMDCSGFVCQCLTAFGIISQRETAQGTYERLKNISQANVYQPGAIVFFGKSTSDICHVGILINDSLMVEAGNGNSRVLTKEDADLANAFIRVRPILARKDLVGALMPNALS